MSRFGMFCAMAALALAALLSPAPAHADIARPLERLTLDQFSETATAIDELAASGDPQAQPVLEALGSARLFVDAAGKRILYRDAAGALRDARDGASVAPAPGQLDVVRVNNRLRGAIQNALGALTLMAPDPARRRAAAEAVFKSRDAAALAPLEAALKAEKDPAVQRLMTQARAAILLAGADTPKERRIESIALLRARADIAAIAALRALPAAADAETRGLAADAIAAIEQRLNLLSYAQNVWYGLSLGSVLLLAAIGLAITFGVMGVINMAHGEMVML
ncbi:MAG TPA: urea ABC transporter permease subunit UrtB, partial [Beijerinckiaceae bacterium]